MISWLRGRPYVGLALTIGCFAIGGGPALADGSGILGGFLNVLGNAVVLSTWQKVDAQTQDCLASRFNMNPSDLAQQGVLATDPRVTPYIEQCQQLAQQDQGQQQQASLEQPKSGMDDQQRRTYLAGRFGKRHADLIVQGNIDIGMDQEEVMLAWGEPTAKNLQGKNGEVWNYGNDNVVFARGRVSAVKH